MKNAMPTLQSLNAGYVDTAGFLALQGLFTAHVTGNFVTFGAAAAQGTTGLIAKLAALPTFCVVVIVARLVSYALPHLGLPVLRSLLVLQVLLLAGGAALAIRLGPFTDGDSLSALLTGMVLVAAMALQNGMHRVHFAKAPPSTLMTGNSTQIMLDLADLLHGPSADQRATIHGRLGGFAMAVLAFALGCGAAAAAFVYGGMWCFLAPPLIVLVLLFAPADDRAGQKAPA